MAIFLGYSTALALLRTLERIDPCELSQARPSIKNASKADDARAAMRELDRLGYSSKDSPLTEQASTNAHASKSPIHLLAACPSTRVQCSGVVSHVWAPPKRRACFIRVSDNLFASTPEACFVQLSSCTSEIQLIKLAFELCGTYRIDSADPVGFKSKEKLANIESLRELAQAQGLGSSAKATRALRYSRNDSASPMETCLALLLGLPTCKGGYGLGVPQLNVEVAAPSGSKANVSWHRYHCDLYWPEQRVALEYNSSAFHLSETAAAKDSSRMNDLAAFGIQGFSATRLQVSDPSAMDQLAKTIARALGKRIRSKYADIEQRRINLRKQLFSKDPWS